MNVALRSQYLNILSICTGGAGLDLGLELAVPGARTVCMVEREGFAVAQLVSAMEAGLLAPAPIWSDARTFNGRPWRGAVDGLIGGIPCQPHSVAGRKKGQLDERDLWSAARRIIVQSRPWFVLIENVGGMLSAGDDEIAGAQRVFRDLSKLGFEIEGGLFTAAEVGAPHKRERIFILAVADSGHEGLQGRELGGSFGSGYGPEAYGPVAELCGSRLGDPMRTGSHARSLTGIHSCEEGAGTRNENPAGSGRAMGNPDCVRELEQNDENGADSWEEPRHSFSGTGCRLVTPMDDASIARSRTISVQPREQDQASRNLNWTSLFPPGPADENGWRSVLERSPHLEPSVRRMADGMAPHVDELRMLGNGVVPLEAAYAFRTLSTRLVRMMGETE